jgi:hypothetical protein
LFTESLFSNGSTCYNIILLSTPYWSLAFGLLHKNVAPTSLRSHTCSIPCLFHPHLSDDSNNLARCTNYITPNYAIFSSLLLLSELRSKYLPQDFVFKHLPSRLRPLMRESKVRTRTNLQVTHLLRRDTKLRIHRKSNQQIPLVFRLPHRQIAMCSSQGSDGVYRTCVSLAVNIYYKYSCEI